MFVDDNGNPEPRSFRPSPPPPARLDECARCKWVELADYLNAGEEDEAGALDALEMYCVAWSRWTVATAKVQAEGAVVLSPNGYGIPNPWLPIGNKAFDQLLRAARRLQLPY